MPLTRADRVSSRLVVVGVGVAAERPTLRLPGLCHRVLHQKRGNGSCRGPAQDLPAGRVGEREQAHQKRSGPKQPSGTEEKRVG